MAKMPNAAVRLSVIISFTLTSVFESVYVWECFVTDIAGHPVWIDVGFFGSYLLLLFSTWVAERKPNPIQKLGKIGLIVGLPFVLAQLIFPSVS
jgi:predicted transporter